MGLIYHLSFCIKTLDLESDYVLLLNVLKDTIVQYVEIIDLINKNSGHEDEPISVLCFFDGQSIPQKIPLHVEREKQTLRNVAKAEKANKILFGLNSVVGRNKRSNIIRNVALLLKLKLYENESFKGIVKTCVINLDDGEADVKIVSSILENSQDCPCVITCDTDILISMDSLRQEVKNDVLILLKFPKKGQYCVTTHLLNKWLEGNSINYRVLLFYFVFFFGCDFEARILSGTKKQIIKVYEFVKENDFKVTSELLLQCWSAMKWRKNNQVLIVNLTPERVHNIVIIKQKSVCEALLYYFYGTCFTNEHPTNFTCFDDWKLLVRSISTIHLKNSIIQSAGNEHNQ